MTVNILHEPMSILVSFERRKLRGLLNIKRCINFKVSSINNLFKFYTSIPETIVVKFCQITSPCGLSFFKCYSKIVL